MMTVPTMLTQSLPMRIHRITKAAIFSLFFFLGSPLFVMAQDPGLADLAREQRNAKQTDTPAQADPSHPNLSQGKGIGELARERRLLNKPAEVKVTEAELQHVFASMNEIITFATDDTGMFSLHPVKRQLVGQDEVARREKEALADSEEAKRTKRSELVLKKFGLFPRNLDLKALLLEGSGKSVAGFYDPRTKTLNLLNWIDLEAQRPIMAHELTHALQDQNYDLTNWAGFKRRTQPIVSKMRVEDDNGEENLSRRAVVEGQAMIVYFDYLLQPFRVRLADNPPAIDFVKNNMEPAYEHPVTMRNAPLLLIDTAIFPYREGLNFEMELLKKGGKDMAFAGAFTRPPHNTHEVLEPSAYFSEEKRPASVMPDLTPVLADKFEPYDSGGMGALEARVMAREYGRDNDTFVIEPAWQGGSYVAVKRIATPALDPEKMTTADVSMLYVSRWKSAEAADRFVELYKKSLGKRVTVKDESPVGQASCLSSGKCPVSGTKVNTSEGPVFLEIWPNHLVFISHSFDDETVARLRQAVMNHTQGPKTRASATPDRELKDLSESLYDLPAFAAFQSNLQREIMDSLSALRPQ